MLELKQEESFVDGEAIDPKVVKLLMDKFKEVFILQVQLSRGKN
ncbi:hypothetical protein [Metaclostridioides mangenotii]|nr:hypothetical protein [Clostridioides mangenotii]